MAATKKTQKEKFGALRTHLEWWKGNRRELTKKPG